MRKIRLDVQGLAVESFDVGGASAGGTIRGYDNTEYSCPPPDPNATGYLSCQNMTPTAPSATWAVWEGCASDGATINHHQTCTCVTVYPTCGQHWPCTLPPVDNG